MPPAFLLTLLAALIFRYLASQVRGQFRARLFVLLRRPLQRGRLISILREHPERMPEFRSRLLPLMATQVALDALACGVFVFALFVFPPAKFGPSDLALIHRGSVLIVAAAMAVEVFQLCLAFGVSLTARVRE